MTSLLFRPFPLAAVRLSNRVVMAPMTRNRAEADGRSNALMAAYYAQRAEAGLIITESTQVAPWGRGYPATPGLHSPAQIDGWRDVVDAVHDRGGRIFVQLWHAGRLSHPAIQPDGALPVAPSAIAPQGRIYTGGGMAPYVQPRALETAEIARVVDDFRAAARNADLAGFDGVEVHGASGYLIDQFLRDGSNLRTDAYGGSVDNRARLLLEIVDGVAAAIGRARVGVRISPVSPFGDMRDSDPQALFGHVAEALGRRALAYLHVAEGGAADFDFAALKRVFGGTYIANGGYDRIRAEAVLEEGRADLVSFGSAFLANPDLVARLRAGAALNVGDRATYYGGGEKGYTDYPAL